VNNEEMFRRIGFEPPVVGNESLSFIFIIISVLVGTAFILLIIRFRKGNLWKLWYFFAVFFAMLVALNPLAFRLFALISINPALAYAATLIVSLGLSLFKVLKPNVIMHNLTEMLVYGGIAALLVPVINLFSAIALLVLISGYDAYAVWKSRHMVTLAQFQKTTNLFAGLYFPYISQKKGKRIVAGKASAAVTPNKTPAESPAAILGGGDIAFPLIFAGTVMKTTGSLLAPFIIAIATTAALSILLMKASKGKFYPAMPFLSLGCFVGFFIWLLIGLI
jgi:presenilin-like A22 family membrane protease